MAPGAQQKRFAAYMDGLAQAAGHGSDGSAEVLLHRIAASRVSGRVWSRWRRASPDNVRRTHQSLHHVVADAPWSDEACWAVREYGWPR